MTEIELKKEATNSFCTIVCMMLLAEKSEEYIDGAQHILHKANDYHESGELKTVYEMTEAQQKELESECKGNPIDAIKDSYIVRNARIDELFEQVVVMAKEL